MLCSLFWMVCFMLNFLCDSVSELLILLRAGVSTQDKNLCSPSVHSLHTMKQTEVSKKLLNKAEPLRTLRVTHFNKICLLKEEQICNNSYK